MKDSFLSLLFSMMEYQGPKYILSTLLKILANEKKVPGNTVLKEYANLFEKAVDEFGGLKRKQQEKT
jgi:hypothetical protein